MYDFFSNSNIVFSLSLSLSKSHDFPLFFPIKKVDHGLTFLVMISKWL